MTILSALLLAATFTRPLERVTTMDPVLASSIYDAHAIALVYETPLSVDYRARPYRLTHGCCELPEMSSDGLVYTLRMRRPGEAPSAADVVRAFERLRDPAIVSPNGWLMKGVGKVSVVQAGAAVEVRLTRKMPYFPWNLSLPPLAVRLPDGSGTGPYRLTSWRTNHEMVFTRKVPDATRFDTVRYLVIDDMSTQWLMFLKGEIDFLGEISRDNWDSILNAEGKIDASLAAKGVRLYTIPSFDAMYLGFNMRDPVLGPNRKLRQALNAAFDYPAWERFYNHRIVEAGGPVPGGVEGQLPVETFAYRFDLEKAKRLIAEAGYPGGIDPKTGRRLVLTLAIGRASQESREAAELMTAFYARLGVNLEHQFMTWDAFLQAVNEGRAQLFRMGWVGDYPHIQNFMQLFYSPNVSPGVNHANYVSAEFDAAYEREDWKRCQEIVREDCPWVFTHFNVANTLVGPRVGDYEPSVFSDGNERHYRVQKDGPKGQ